MFLQQACQHVQPLRLLRTAEIQPQMARLLLQFLLLGQIAQTSHVQVFTDLLQHPVVVG